MKVTVIGTGYVGLVTASCLSEMGNDVWCVDIDKNKIDNLNHGIIPIFEPGLEDMVKRNHAEGRLRFSTDITDGLDDSLFAIIAVGTPSGEDGSADLKHVLKAAKTVGKHINRYTIIINKSTVPVGTADRVRAAVKEELISRGRGDIEYDVVSNPEFLKEGDAIEDFMRPDRIIVGVDSDRAAGHLKELYGPFQRRGDKVLIMDIRSSELTKYAANAMLATRISFMNELSLLCENCGADIEKIREGIGSDSRIGRSFLYAGLGYGGSCFPKDVRAIIHTMKENGIDAALMPSVERVNKNQRKHFIRKVLKHFGNDLSGLTFAVWGLSFKPQTDDMREAASVDIIRGLTEKGAKVRAHDPIAINSARAALDGSDIEYFQNSYEALKGADAMLLITEWHQFRRPDFERMKSLMKTPVIFDGRNQYDPAAMRSGGFTYYCVGRQQTSRS